jgi:hypothetical protein
MGAWYKKINFSLCLANLVLRHEGAWGSGCIDPHFLDLSTSWRWVVSFTPRPLYLQGNSPRYSLDRRLGVPQSWSGLREEEKILDPSAIWNPTPSIVQPAASRYNDYTNQGHDIGLCIYIGRNCVLNVFQTSSRKFIKSSKCEIT